MANPSEANEAKRAIPYPSSLNYDNKYAHAAALADYRRAHLQVIAEFRAYLEDTYGSNHSYEQQQKLWNAAWNNGNASGYHEVQGLYIEYSELSNEELGELEY